jgi:hypothetical protein
MPRRNLANASEKQLGQPPGRLYQIARLHNPRSSSRYEAAVFTTCIVILYCYSLDDFALKFLPLQYALPLRYLPELIMYMLAVMNFAKYRHLGRPFALGTPLLAFALVSVLSTAVNLSSPLAALSEYRSFFRFAALSYTMSKLSLDSGRIRSLFRHLLIICGIQIGVGATETIFGSTAREFFKPNLTWLTQPSVQSQAVTPGFGWISGTLSNYNHYGMFLALCCILVFCMWLHYRKLPLALLAAVAGFGVIYSYSRHAMLDLLLGVSIVLLLRTRLSVSLPFTALAIAFAVVAVKSSAIAYTPGEDITVTQRIENAFSASATPQENVRLYLLQQLPPRFLSLSPFLGFGPAKLLPDTDIPFVQTEDLFNPDTAPDIPLGVLIYAGDVSWLEILGCYGCLGVAAMLYLYATVAKQAFDVRKRAASPSVLVLAEVCIAWFAVLTVGGFFGADTIARDTVPALWIVAGVVLSQTGRRMLVLVPARSMN